VRKARDVVHTRTLETLRWNPANLEALAQAVSNYGTRWADIAAMRYDDLADYTPDELKICSKVLFCHKRFQAPQCTSFHYGYVSIERYRYSGSAFLDLWTVLSMNTYRSSIIFQYAYVFLIWLQLSGNI
jgi:hypothetical protein